MKALKVLTLTAVLGLNVPVFASSAAVKTVTQSVIKASGLETQARMLFKDNAESVVELIRATDDILIEKAKLDQVADKSLAKIWNPEGDAEVAAILSKDSSQWTEAEMIVVLKNARKVITDDKRLDVQFCDVCTAGGRNEIQQLTSSIPKLRSQEDRDYLAMFPSVRVAFDSTINQLTQHNKKIKGSNLVAFGNLTEQQQKDMISVLNKGVFNILKVKNGVKLNAEQKFIQYWIAFSTVDGKFNPFDNNLWRSVEGLQGDNLAELGMFLQKLSKQAPMDGESRVGNLKAALKAVAERPNATAEQKQNYEDLVTNGFCGFLK